MRQADSYRCDDFRIGVVGVEGQWVAPADLEVDVIPRQDGLEQADDILVSVAQDKLVIHSD